MLSHVAALLTFSTVLVAADGPSAVQYRWIKELGGSLGSSVAAVAVDAAGNTYVTGSTASLDFPTKQAFQNRPGGTGLIRVNTATNTSAYDYGIGLNTVDSLAQDPRNPQNIYATADSQVMHSTDGGATWSPIRVPGQVNAVAIDRTNSSILYAAVQVRGILKSVNGGQTWSASGDGIKPAGDGKLYGYTIWIDPRNPSILFANTYNGLFRSGDAGASWTQSVMGTQVAFDPFTPGVVYALTYSHGVATSTDSGVTFSAGVAPPNTVQQFTTILPDPLHKGVLYAAGYNGLFKSTDGGASWTSKLTGQYKIIFADPSKQLLYAVPFQQRILASKDGFETTLPVGPSVTTFTGTPLVVGDTLLVPDSAGTDGFITKIDRNGEIVYSTYFGGGSSEQVAAIVVDASGNAFITGTTSSADFPVTPGAYRTMAPTNGGSFLLRLTPDGQLAWSTWFTDTETRPVAIALNAQGNPYLTGQTSGDLPTTPSAYQPKLVGVFIGGFIGPTFPPTNAFMAEFSASGSDLLAATYVGTQNATANAIAVDSNGTVYLAGNPLFGNGSTFYRVKPDGSALIGSSQISGGLVNAMAFGPDGNLYVAGTTSTFPPLLYTTPDSFEPVPIRQVPQLPGSAGTSNGAFVTKYLPDFSSITASTLLAGDVYDSAMTLAFDPSGNVVLGGSTFSLAFPTRTPSQGPFNNATGFLSALNPALSSLLVSTYVGDNRPFQVHTMAINQQNDMIFAGTANPNGGDSAKAIVASVNLGSAPTLRIDAVVNAASQLGEPLSPDAAIQVQGSGFASDAQVLIDGAPATIYSRNSNSIGAIIPKSVKPGQSAIVQIQSAGSTSNSVVMPVANAAPGVFTLNGSGFGQGLILNQDGTQNSPTNPAAENSIITIFATGVGVPVQVPSVYIDGFYASGVDDHTGPVAGLPGNVYQIRVFVPKPSDWVDRNPNLLNFKMPPQVPVRLDISGQSSQSGLILSVK